MGFGGRRHAESPEVKSLLAIKSYVAIREGVKNIFAKNVRKGGGGVLPESVMFFGTKINSLKGGFARLFLLDIIC